MLLVPRISQSERFNSLENEKQISEPTIQKTAVDSLHAAGRARSGISGQGSIWQKDAISRLLAKDICGCAPVINRKISLST